MVNKTISILALAALLTGGQVLAQEQGAGSQADDATTQKPAATAASGETPKVDSEVKELSGISIIGNEEAPKSLYIVPWQNSEVGVATSLQSGLFDDSMRPVQMEVFRRELKYYELSQ